MRLIIAGGRDFENYPLLCQTMAEFAPEIILCGKAKGADTLGEKWAKENGIKIDYYPALWEKHGRAAGPIRNTEMAKNATHLLAFHDGKSKGTSHMIKVAENHKLLTKVVIY
jgi:YspA, cpYpsA-related SLOG family